MGASDKRAEGSCGIAALKSARGDKKGSLVVKGGYQPPANLNYTIYTRSSLYILSCHSVILPSDIKALGTLSPMAQIIS